MKMKKFMLILVAAVLVTLTVNCYAAQQPEEAKAMVKKAITFLKANGKEKAFAEFNNPSGKFVKGELYIFVYEPNGTMVANGQNMKLINKNLLGFKDSDGKLFVQEFMAVAKKGSGWVDYKWTNSVTKQIQAKTTYIEATGDLIIGCGVYK
jgi:cytochrome c